MTEVLGGRYELGEVIGRGGMAEVRHGNDVRLGRDVAVKVLRADLATDPSFQARFRREAQSAAALDAPCIVAVYDTGEDGRGVPWIVMEYVDGRTLRDVLTTEGRLLPQRALEVTADVCSALEVAHAAGMVHRDIKPANVMLTSRGEVKVMDFGIARAAAGSESTMTRTESVIGTAAYLSPEQARGEHVDARSDVYSTGCLLYELVTGSPPFTGDSPVAVAYQHVREDPRPPSTFDPSLSEETAATLDAVVLKAMAKNPANRYQSADEMREDLLRAVAGRPVLATPVLESSAQTSWEAAPPKSRANVVYGISAAVALVLAVVTGLLVHALLGTPSGLIKPPDVTGLPQRVAITQLADAGLVVDGVDGAFSKERPAGTVISQTPDENFLIKRGDTVSLVVSKGIEITTVPQVLGLSQADMANAFSAAKLTVKLRKIPGNRPGEVVLGITPVPGTRLEVGSSVFVDVSSGTNEVPDVRGLAQDQAIAALGSAGFGIAVRGVPTSVTPGTVLGQNPVKVQAPVGSNVLIDVAYDPAGPPPAGPQAPVAPTATPAPSPTP